MSIPKGGTPRVALEPTRSRRLRLLAQETPRTSVTPASGLRRHKILVAVLLYLCAVCAMNIRGVSPGSLRGRRALSDRIAREDFSYVDEAATSRAGSAAAEIAPRAYRQIPGWLWAPRTKGLLLAGGSPGADLERLLKEAGILMSPDAFMDGCPGAAEALDAVLEELAGGGIISDGRAEEERASGRKEVRVLHSGGSVKARLDGRDPAVSNPLRLRAAIPDALRKRLSGGREDFSAAVAASISAEITPNLVLDEAETLAGRRRASTSVERVSRHVAKGQVFIRRGEYLDETSIGMIEAEEAVYDLSRPVQEELIETGFGALLALGVMVGLGLAAFRFSGELAANDRLALSYGILFVVGLFGARAASAWGFPYLAPVVLFSCLASPACGQAPAGLGALGVALLGGMGLPAMSSLALGGVVAAVLARALRRRNALLWVGAASGAVAAVVALGAEATSGAEAAAALRAGGWALGGALAGGLFAVVMLPAVELISGVTTGVALLDLSDQNQPALRRLLATAPGTYHHSLIVGNLAEAAAEAIGADPLLARVASYFHDIGKIAKPEYFVENESPGRSRHEHLSPAMSALIIAAHVKDGVELARAYRLPRAVREIIGQHHGTTLIEYFYHQAKERAGPGVEVDESVFRYPGPRPRTREAGIVLVADALDAASRTLSDPSPARIESLVHEITQKRLLEGQFDRCGLTFRDLAGMEGAFARILNGMFHGRKPYPGQKGYKSPGRSRPASRPGRLPRGNVEVRGKARPEGNRG